MEVVVAVAVFAGAIVAVIGMLGPSLRATREVLDSAVAARLAAGVDQELRAYLSRQPSGMTQLLNATDGGRELVFVADQAGSRVVDEIFNGTLNSTSVPPQLDPSLHYFRIVLAQLESPLSSPHFAALQVRVEWPYRLPGGVEAAPAERTTFTYNTSARP
jgi:hypothetical protein